MNSKLTIALSEFSKGRWASEPSNEPRLHSTGLNLVTGVWSWLGKLGPLAFGRYLIAFFIGVAATVALQSYRDATAPARLDLRQSIDRLAAEITKVQAVDRDILDRISAQPAAAPPRRPVTSPGQATPLRSSQGVPLR